MLDLTTIAKKQYELKYVDGKVYTLRLPSQQLLLKLVSIQKNMDKPEVIFPTLTGLLTDILNLNTQGRVFTEQEVEKELDLGTAVLVIKDYLTETTKTLGE